MSLYKCEGIVLRTRNLGEADRVITLYTLEKGKLEGVARGARRPRSRLMGGTQLFTHGLYMLFSGRSLDSVSQVEIKRSFAPLREELTPLAYCSYMAELFDVIVMPGEPSEELFQLLQESFVLMEEARVDAGVVLRRFELGLMSVLGYQPHLHSCVRCGGEVGADIRLSVAEGGLLCRSCWGVDSAALPLTRATVEWMKRLPRTPAARLGALRLSSAESRLLESACRAYVDYRLARPLKSVSFMASLQNLA